MNFFTSKVKDPLLCLVSAFGAEGWLGIADPRIWLLLDGLGDTLQPLVGGEVPLGECEGILLELLAGLPAWSEKQTGISLIKH